MVTIIYDFSKYQLGLWGGRTVLPKTELPKRDPRRIAEIRIEDLDRIAEK